MFVFARFRAANHQFAAEEFFVVQFLHCALGFFDRLHRDEGETFGALIVAIAHDLGVLHVTDPVKEFEEITLGRVEGQIADVETRRRDFDGFGWTLRPRFAVALALLLLLLAVTPLWRWFPLAAVASKKCDDTLPKCFLLRSLCAFALILKTSAPAPSSRPAAPMALASPV